MKDLYKNPVLYYIMVPVLVGMWPLLVWAVYLPAAEEDRQEQIAQHTKAEPVMLEILTLDPGRLEFADPNDTAAEFTYGGAVDWVASLCKIPPTVYNVSASTIITANNQRTQSAKVDLRRIDITRFAKFLSMIQLRWGNLQCERVKLSKKEGLGNNDAWDVDIEFKYYY
ncbi:MAG: hypothetical protein JSW66_00130 [Phycisphaerales bacterium]|nr:MAG: hypothetical protein JSW66_00130 [Phycisphaerales bacterium]